MNSRVRINFTLGPLTWVKIFRKFSKMCDDTDF